MEVTDGDGLADLVQVVDSDHGASDEVLADRREHDCPGHPDSGQDCSHPGHVDPDRGEARDHDDSTDDLGHEEQQLLAVAVVVDPADHDLGHAQDDDRNNTDHEDAPARLRCGRCDAADVDRTED